MANTQRTKQTAVANRPPSTEDRDSPDSGNETHEVKDGESLEDIASHYKVEPATIQRLNSVKRPDLIWAGMTLRIPRRDPRKPIRG
ncbi:MAG: LysM domain [Microbacterium sp.]|jgi:LysM repeat protein|nr:LysM domain [Microbacterium sp.]